MSMSFARNLKTKIQVLPKKPPPPISPLKPKATKLQIDLDEYTISHVHQQINILFKGKKLMLKSLQKELDRALWIEKNGVHETDQKTAQKKIVLLRKQIRDLEGSFEYALYLVKTYGILQEYTKIASELNKNSFLRPQKNNSLIHKKNTADVLIDEYLRTARDYVQIKNYIQNSKKLTCMSCHGNKFQQTNEINYCCLGCGEVQEIIDVTPTFRDSNRINMCSRYTYTRKGHFVDAMKRFQGRQNTTIDPSVYKILRSEIKAHGLTYENATMEHLYEFLESNRLSKHYGDINLIYSVITGNPAPDISEYEAELLEMFDETEEAYEKVKDPGRINSLNVNFKLFKLLQRIGYPCKRDDFYILKTAVKWCEHENKWDEIRILKGWKYIPTIY